METVSAGKVRGPTCHRCGDVCSHLSAETVEHSGGGRVAKGRAKVSGGKKIAVCGSSRLQGHPGLGKVRVTGGMEWERRPAISCPSSPPASLEYQRPYVFSTDLRCARGRHEESWVSRGSVRK